MGKSDNMSIERVSDGVLIDELTRRGYTVFEPLVLLEDIEPLAELEPIAFDNNFVL